LPCAPPWASNRVLLRGTSLSAPPLAAAGAVVAAGLTAGAVVGAAAGAAVGLAAAGAVVGAAAAGAVVAAGFGAAGAVVGAAGVGDAWLHAASRPPTPRRPTETTNRRRVVIPRGKASSIAKHPKSFRGLRSVSTMAGLARPRQQTPRTPPARALVTHARQGGQLVRCGEL